MQIEKEREESSKRGRKMLKECRSLLASRPGGSECLALDQGPTGKSG